MHFLRGEKPGPTVFVQGGIQGDEIGGFLTAQMLTKAKVTRGTVIIVPRANPPSIHERKRAINVDLNRRFDQDYNEFYEDRLARSSVSSSRRARPWCTCTRAPGSTTR